MARQCIFCGSAERLTIEHVFGDWISRTMTLPPDHELVHTMESASRGRTQRRTKKIDIKARVVCGGCNSGWMSQIESKAKQVLLPLFAGRTTHLTTSDRQTLKTWITKTALMTAFVSPGITSVVTSEVTQRFYGDPESFPCGNAWIGQTGQSSPQTIFKVIPRLMNASLSIRGEHHVFYCWTAVVGRLVMMSSVFPTSMWKYESTLAMNGPPFLLSLDASEPVLVWPPKTDVPDIYTYAFSEPAA